MALVVESADELPGRARNLDRAQRLLAVQQMDEKAEDERDDRPEHEFTLAGIGPDRPDGDADPAGGAHAGDVADEVAVARARVGPGKVEAAQPRVDGGAARPGEDVDARARRLEQERVGQAGGARLGLVALRPFGLELADDFLVAVGRGLRRPQGVAAGMGQFVEQRRIVDVARVAIERGIGGAGQRHRRIGAVGRVDPRDHDPRERALGPGERLDRLGEPVEGEGLAGAAGPGDRGEERRLHLRRHAELPQRLHHRPRFQHVRAFGGVGQEDRRRGGAGPSAAGRGDGLRGRRGGEGAGWLRRGSPSRRILAVSLISDNQPPRPRPPGLPGRLEAGRVPLELRSSDGRRPGLSIARVDGLRGGLPCRAQNKINSFNLGDAAIADSAWRRSSHP